MAELSGIADYYVDKAVEAYVKGQFGTAYWYKQLAINYEYLIKGQKTLREILRKTRRRYLYKARKLAKKLAEEEGIPFDEAYMIALEELRPEFEEERNELIRETFKEWSKKIKELIEEEFKKRLDKYPIKTFAVIHYFGKILP